MTTQKTELADYLDSLADQLRRQQDCDEQIVIREAIVNLSLMRDRWDCSEHRSGAVIARRIEELTAEYVAAGMGDESARLQATAFVEAHTVPSGRGEKA